MAATPNSMTQGVLVDTGPLVALLSADDQHHAACVAAAKTLAGPFFTVWPVITDAAYLLRTRPSAVAMLFERAGTGQLRLAELTSGDVLGIQSIVARYADQRFDLADAAIMHVAQRDRVHRVFTTDVRHFSLYRTMSGASLDLYPLKMMHGHG